MRKALLWLAAGVAAVLTVPAQAAIDFKMAAHAAVYYGTYHIDYHCCSASDSAKSPGGGLGLTLGIGRAFVDANIDYFEVKDGVGFDYERTDFTLTGGAKIIDWLSAFGGFRFAWQDTSTMFDNDVWNEYGFFLGPGVGPFPMGPIRLSASAAYNYNKVKVHGGTTYYSYNGGSAKLRFALAKSPHAIELRFQQFDNTDATSPLNFKEQYAYIGYIFTWGFLNR